MLLATVPFVHLMMVYIPFHLMLRHNVKRPLTLCCTATLCAELISQLFACESPITSCVSRWFEHVRSNLCWVVRMRIYVLRAKCSAHHSRFTAVAARHFHTCTCTGVRFTLLIRSVTPFHLLLRIGCAIHTSSCNAYFVVHAHETFLSFEFSREPFFVLVLLPSVYT